MNLTHLMTSVLVSPNSGTDAPRSEVLQSVSVRYQQSIYAALHEDCAFQLASMIHRSNSSKRSGVVSVPDSKAKILRPELQPLTQRGKACPSHF